MVTIFSNSSAELISGLDQSGAFRLVFGLSQNAQPRTKPKSEVTHCVSQEVRQRHLTQVDKVDGSAAIWHYQGSK